VNYKKFDTLLSKFRVKHGVVKDFLDTQEKYFSTADVDRSNVGSIETALMRCDAADSALARYEPLVASLEEMSSQVDESHVAHAEMAEKSAAARAAHSAVSDQSAGFREGLNADLAKEKELLETAKTCVRPPPLVPSSPRPLVPSSLVPVVPLRFVAFRRRRHSISFRRRRRCSAITR
jgi:hypothetical protein